MTDNQKKRAELHKVSHVFSGKHHFFKVITPEKIEHEVAIQVHCGKCRHMSIVGSARATICSHILSVFKNIWEKGDIKLQNES